MTKKIYLLRLLHGLASLYFIGCLVYLYYAAVTGEATWFLVVALVSLAAEGYVVFVVNNGDCPLIHVQRKMGDNKPFFELFMPSKLAKQAIPCFAVLTWLAVALLLVRWLSSL